MHSAVLQWVNESFNKWDFPEKENLKILEFGSLDINGSVRSILQGKSSLYIGVDIQNGPGVDIVADAESFDIDEAFHAVVCCEVFEHTPRWREIISNAHRLLLPGGVFIATMAGEGRPPHSAIDENPIREWEYYANVGAWELSRHLNMFSSKIVDYFGLDLRASAVK